MSLKFLAQIVIAVIGTIVITGIVGHVLHQVKIPKHKLTVEEKTFESPEDAAKFLANEVYDCWESHSYGEAEKPGTCGRFKIHLTSGKVCEKDIAKAFGGDRCGCPKGKTNCILYTNPLGKNPIAGAGGGAMMGFAAGAAIAAVGIVAGVFTGGLGTVITFAVAGGILGGVTGTTLEVVTPTQIQDRTSKLIRDHFCNGCNSFLGECMGIKPSNDLFRLKGRCISGESDIGIAYKMFCGFSLAGLKNPGWICYGIELDVK